MPVPPTSTLQAIQTKVRRLTRKPSTAQISDTDLQNYINTFVVYDFPEQLRTFNLRKTFTFFTNPLQDVYITDSTLPQTNPLYNFQNIYLTSIYRFLPQPLGHQADISLSQSMCEIAHRICIPVYRHIELLPFDRFPAILRELRGQ